MPGTTKAELARARRVRAGVIGLLECCRCTYPIEQHDTETGHALTCPAHAMTLSARAVDSHAGCWRLGIDGGELDVDARDAAREAVA